MRSASVILLATAAFALVVWLLTHTGLWTTSVIDAFLGLQLYRLRHSWRVWAMLRAGVGLVAGALIVFGGVVVPRHAITIILWGLGQIAYCVSIFLLLFGTPSERRVWAGRVVFGLSLALSTAATMFQIASAEPQPETDFAN